MKKTSFFLIMASAIGGAVIAKSFSPVLMSAQRPAITHVLSDSAQTSVPTDSVPTFDSLQAVVSAESVPLSFGNDEKYPWTFVDGYLQNGNVGQSNSLSALTFSFECDQPTELSFDWACYNYSGYHELYLYVDGQQISSTTSSSFTTERHFLTPGSHVVTIMDLNNGYTYDQYDWSRLGNICVKALQPLEPTVLTSKSQPITFVNEMPYPWTVEDGYIQSSNYGHNNTASRFTATVTVDTLSKLSFWSSTYYYNGDKEYSYSGYHYFSFKINGQTYMGREYGSGTTSVVLSPGEYTLEWCDSIYNYTANVKSRVKDIELSSDWITLDLAQAGTLGVEVLQQVDVLNDVELLKVKGSLNSDDWTVIKNMSNLMGLDLSEATFSSLPDNAFDGLDNLSNVVLPDGLTSIGQYAFRGTQLLEIDIPSTVTTIGQYAFAGTTVQSVNFKDDSKLASIGYSAFKDCTSLEQFIMPNTVTSLGLSMYYGNDCSTFFGCSKLKKLHFSDALTTLGQYVCYDCSNLQEVHLPASLQSIGSYAFQQCGIDSLRLPATLSSLGNYAFSECYNLRYVELPSCIGSYYSNFSNCTSLQTVVCPSATPPTISSDPFQGGSDKSAMTLVVPSFAVANYKLDCYWYQFGNIMEMDTDLDYWRVAGNLSLTNNRRMNGQPDLDLYYGGQLTVGGQAPMTLRHFNIYVNESNPGRLLNDCASLTTDSLTTRFAVDANRWYFLTPFHDVDLTQVTHSANASFVFRYYDAASRATNGTGSSWRNVEDSLLQAGKGYIFQCNKSGELVLPADSACHIQAFNTGDATTALATHESTASANKNWNYVGNPYPTYYDIYYMDFTAPVTVWTGSTYKAYSIADDDLVLRPMQAFFVQKPDAIDRIVFHKEGRQLTSAADHAQAAKARAQAAAHSARRLFNLALSNEAGLTDETRVVVNPDALTAYEIERDASKFMSVNTAVPQLFTVDTDGTRYAINERPQADGNIALGYLAPTDGFYTISALKADGSVVLYDKTLNKYTDLSVQDYTFHSASTAGADLTRFTLMVKAGGTTGIGTATTPATPAATVEGGKGTLRIAAPCGSRVVVATLNGTTVCHTTAAAAPTTLPLPAGAYIVTVGGTSAKVVVY